MSENAHIFDQWQILKTALLRYAVEGRLPGHFLSAVLENDLFEAACRADDTSILLLRGLVRLVHNELPGDCHGSPEAVAKWSGEKHEDVRSDLEFNLRTAYITNFDSKVIR